MDYLLIGILYFWFLGVGVCSIVWPHRMRWTARSFITLPMSDKERDVYTRVGGIVTTVVALIFAFFVIKNSF
ncbi:MAG TPA: hypothetical protein VJ866_16935 [Pyrinomonadaceae bacterium]|nr:hypothetical protein [Pyrinomonadaceae bacterium]